MGKEYDAALKAAEEELEWASRQEFFAAGWKAGSVEAMKRIAGDTIPPITAGFIRAYDEVNGPIHAAMSASKEGA